MGASEKVWSAGLVLSPASPTLLKSLTFGDCLLTCKLMEQMLFELLSRSDLPRL